MGMARKASSGNRWASWFRLRESVPRGAPVPGTGRRHYHKRKSGSNKTGSLRKPNGEWSSKGRKRQDDQRGINNAARRQNIAEQVAEIYDERYDSTTYRRDD